MKWMIGMRRALVLCAVLGMTACSKEEGSADGGKVDIAAQTAILKSGADANAKVDACTELGKAGERAAEAVPALIELLKDQDGLVRRMAAYALGEIGPKAKAAVPALQPLMSDPVREVMTQAANSLRAIDPASAPKIDASGQ